MITLSISSKNFDKMISYAQLAYKEYGSEISGMLPVIKKDNKLVMCEPEILKQDCTPGTTDLDKDALSVYFNEKTTEYINLVPNNIIYCWWHSHHNMDAFWSGTDTSTINGFAQNGSIFAIVVNNKAEYKITYAEKRKVAGVESIVHSKVELEIENNNEDALLKEIKEKVSVERGASKYKGLASFVPRSQVLADARQQSVFNKQTAYEEEIDWSEEDQWNESFETNEIEEDIKWSNKSIENDLKPVAKKGTGPRTIEKAKAKLEIMEESSFISSDRYPPVQEVVEMLENSCNNYIYDYNTTENKNPELDEQHYVNEVNSYINEIREDIKRRNLHKDEYKAPKYHTITSMKGILTINDLKINEEVIDEYDYREISKHIPTQQSLL